MIAWRVLILTPFADQAQKACYFTARRYMSRLVSKRSSAPVGISAVHCYGNLLVICQRSEKILMTSFP